MLLFFSKELFYTHGWKFSIAKFPIMMIQRWLCILQFLWNWLYNILQENYLFVIAKFKPFVADHKFDLIVSNQFRKKTSWAKWNPTRKTKNCSSWAEVQRDKHTGPNPCTDQSVTGHYRILQPEQYARCVLILPSECFYHHLSGFSKATLYYFHRRIFGVEFTINTFLHLN